MQLKEVLFYSFVICYDFLLSGFRPLYNIIFCTDRVKTFSVII